MNHFCRIYGKNVENRRIIKRQNKEVVVGVVMIKMYRRRCRCKRGCVLCVDKDENAHVWTKTKTKTNL